MPIGMMLRSNWTATSIAEFRGELSLDSYRESSGQEFGTPVPIDRFIEYGEWVQRKVASDVDRRVVSRIESDGDSFHLTLSDEAHLGARRVVVACGIAPFAWRPRRFSALDPTLASHTSDHRDFSKFRGKNVVVVGGGQSSLETAALLHEEGAETQVLVRANHIHWLHGGKYHRMLGSLAPLVYAPTDVGPMGLSRLVAVPDVFRRLPRRVQEPLARRSIRPAGAAWLGPRLDKVPVRLAQTISKAVPKGDRLRLELANGQVYETDHLLFGTGYRVDVARYPFLGPRLLRGLERIDGYPVLRPGLETSIPGLHIIGAPAAWSFGPIMRFVSGSWYTGRALVRSVTGSVKSIGHEPFPHLAAG
jgi:hypothetical protein